MRHLGAAINGRKGLGPWLGLHMAAYIALLIGWLGALLVIYEGGVQGVRDIPGLMVWGLGPFAPLMIVATSALTAIAWALRELNRVVFRAATLVLCTLPLACLLGPEPIRLMAPVQILFGLLIRRPHWVHPLDRVIRPNDG